MKKEIYSFGRKPKYNAKAYAENKKHEKEISKTANGIMVIGIAAMAFFLAISISDSQKSETADENINLSDMNSAYSVFAENPQEYGIYVPTYRDSEGTEAVKEALLEIFGMGGAN